MSETQRLSAWGWLVRAFAGGFGAMFVSRACGLSFAESVCAVGSFPASLLDHFS